MESLWSFYFKNIHMFELTAIFLKMQLSHFIGYGPSLMVYKSAALTFTCEHECVLHVAGNQFSDKFNNDDLKKNGQFTAISEFYVINFTLWAR